MTPTTVTQLAILVAFVIPGIVYQAVRARLAGESPQNRDTTNKVLRALAASVVLASIYLIVLGPLLMNAVGAGGDRTRAWISTHPRRTGLLALVLLYVVPTTAAFAAARRWRYGQRIGSHHHRGPLAPTRPLGRSLVGRATNRLLTVVSDHSQAGTGCATSRHQLRGTGRSTAAAPGSGSSESSARTDSGAAVRSATSSTSRRFPSRRLGTSNRRGRWTQPGVFVAPQDQTRGAWIPCADALTVEFTHPRAPAARNPTA